MPMCLGCKVVQSKGPSLKDGVSLQKHKGIVFKQVRPNRSLTSLKQIYKIGNLFQLAFFHWDVTYLNKP